MNKKFSLKSMGPLLKQSFKGFSEDKVPKLSASLAYYTIFSLAPMLVVIISVAGFVLGQEAVSGQLYHQIGGIVGPDSAKQIQEMIASASLSGKTTLSLIIGIITLLIGASSMFGEMQDSINGIWGLKVHPKAGIKAVIVNRIISFGMVATLGFLLLVSLAATALVEGLGGRLQRAMPGLSVAVLYILNLVLTVGVTTVLFAGIFKVLPDAKIKWKDVWIGAGFTALLFLIGKFLIGLYIAKSDIGSTFGSAGSLIVLLVWIYYSAIILYFGAEFTKHYLVEYGPGIQPNQYAVPMEGSIVASAEPKRQPQTEPLSPADPQQPWRTRPYPTLVVHGPRDPQLAHADERRKGTKVGPVKAMLVATVATLTGLIGRGRG
ncbi:YihY/virulence factor BrkB family protein [Flaviaesturariibacter flavus]|uniref:YihY/virulence factor BrkB family protein n=1 Tax=Flaviaesturariibacter flavus TaxID=2502780 RepID=A0A4R1BBD0_9BACT|nr:YihY/virulence factor BrkB family protein [Flaviaesturariibacter flavus]TCJ14311.1 YihY/virulence factor BrkB family protein [Flaviaesturariibacter flavus]